MKNWSFGNQFFFVLAIVFVLEFTTFRYLENTNVIQSVGFWSTVTMALVLSAIPSILICIALRYRK
jgi:hypothetical protein